MKFLPVGPAFDDVERSIGKRQAFVELLIVRFDFARTRAEREIDGLFIEFEERIRLARAA